jgi:ribokinase
MNFDVVVVGSINYDISVLTPRLPRPGETLIGTEHFFGPGGKGANQAVAVARLGASVALVGSVGSDEWGESLVTGLADEGIDVSAVGTDGSALTGIAVITIDSNAENTIVGSSGANMEMTPAYVSGFEELIAAGRVVLVQLEIPLATVEAVARLATGTLIHNTAPAQTLPEELLKQVDVLIPNRSELALLAGHEVLDGVDQVVSAARSLRPEGITVVTLGTDGAVVIDEDSVTRITTVPVDAVDPTGAGDAFCGAFAYSLSQGMSQEDAARFASAAGALSVTKKGAREGLPTKGDVEALLAG